MSSLCPYCSVEVTHTTTVVDDKGPWTVFQPCGHPAPPATTARTYTDLLTMAEEAERFQAQASRAKVSS